MSESRRSRSRLRSPPRNRGREDGSSRRDRSRDRRDNRESGRSRNTRKNTSSGRRSGPREGAAAAADSWTLVFNRYNSPRALTPIHHLANRILDSMYSKPIIYNGKVGQFERNPASIQRCIDSQLEKTKSNLMWLLDNYLLNSAERNSMAITAYDCSPEYAANPAFTAVYDSTNADKNLHVDDRVAAMERPERRADMSQFESVVLVDYANVFYGLCPRVGEDGKLKSPEIINGFNFKNQDPILFENYIYRVVAAKHPNRLFIVVNSNRGTRSKSHSFIKLTPNVIECNLNMRVDCLDYQRFREYDDYTLIALYTLFAKPHGPFGMDRVYVMSSDNYYWFTPLDPVASSGASSSKWDIAGRERHITTVRNTVRPDVPEYPSVQYFDASKELNSIFIYNQDGSIFPIRMKPTVSDIIHLDSDGYRLTVKHDMFQLKVGGNIQSQYFSSAVFPIDTVNVARMVVKPNNATSKGKQPAASVSSSSSSSSKRPLLPPAKAEPMNTAGQANASKRPPAQANVSKRSPAAEPTSTARPVVKAKQDELLKHVMDKYPSPSTEYDRNKYIYELSQGLHGLNYSSAAKQIVNLGSSKLDELISKNMETTKPNVRGLLKHYAKNPSNKLSYFAELKLEEHPDAPPISAADTHTPNVAMPNVAMPKLAMPNQPVARKRSHGNNNDAGTRTNTTTQTVKMNNPNNGKNKTKKASIMSVKEILDEEIKKVHAKYGSAWSGNLRIVIDEKAHMANFKNGIFTNRSMIDGVATKYREFLQKQS
jgi:hypothetical protein